MIQNFDFLKQYPFLQPLYQNCIGCETQTDTIPDNSVFQARKALEYGLKQLWQWKIAMLPGVLPGGQDQCLFDMLKDYHVINLLTPDVITTCHAIRKIGNLGTHENNQVSSAEARSVLDGLKIFVNKFAEIMKLKVHEVPTVPADPEDLKTFLSDRLRDTAFDISDAPDSEGNKMLCLLATFRESGWPLICQPHAARESAVGLEMKLSDGSEIDYIFYGKDKKPLAVLDYKLTSQDLPAGRANALRAADLIAKQYGRKPIVYYSDGYAIFCIDPLGFPPRRVHQFHSLDEMELLLWRVNNRKDISNPAVNTNTCGRPYQVEAVQAACKAYTHQSRGALLVMATGTGKTRTAIAITDILTKANWVKNVLFLADRTSLVLQAKKNFAALLPDQTLSVYTGGSSCKDPDAHIIFSTYQSMMNLIDGENKEFDIGRFDLIIIDEAHRSIFNKFGSLFDYFDALLLGLTATPREENNKSTYERFGKVDGEPDSDYPLSKAVSDGFLVGFEVLDRTTEKIREGLKFAQLSKAEQDQFDTLFEDEDPDSITIRGAALANRVINEDTIRKMLDDLMTHGLKVEDGNKLGKTIIFAGSHVHAEAIVRIFRECYPEQGRNFCALIDSQTEDALNRLDLFETREKLPQIAVSVDMLDTGVDVPDILNLVFFKCVRSRIKFLQMIGRGTRLSKEIYGPELDKEGFRIFDYFDNFDYFEFDPATMTGKPASAPKAGGKPTLSLHQRTQRYRLLTLQQLQQNGTQTDFEAQYQTELKEALQNQVIHLVNDVISVKDNLNLVNLYRTDPAWEKISEEDLETMQTCLLPLLPSDGEHQLIKCWDCSLYQMEANFVRLRAQGLEAQTIHAALSARFIPRIAERMEDLLKQKSIPQVMAKEKELKAMRGGTYLMEDFSLERAEEVRKSLRELMVFLPKKQIYFITDVEDVLIEVGTQSSAAPQKPYAQRVDEYLARSGDPLLSKLRTLDPLSPEEKAELTDVFQKQLGTPVEYAALFGTTSLLPYLRKRLGIDPAAIQSKFGHFLNPETLNPGQMAFMNCILAYVKTNGDITMQELLSSEPFVSMDISSVFNEAQIKYVQELVRGIHGPIADQA